MTRRRADPRPPRVAEALLALCLPPGGLRETVLGDLHELFCARAAGASGGRIGAALWYWSQALRISTGYAARRLRGVRHPRLGTEPGPHAGRGEVMGEGGSSIVADLGRDARFALRAFRRSPGFLVVALVTLALGVGANAAIFSVVRAVYLRPLDFHDPDRIVQLGRSAEDGSYRMEVQTPATWSDWSRGQASFQDFAGYRYWTTTIERNGIPSRALAVHSLGSIFDVLGVPALLGRTFTSAEEGPGRENLAVLSHAYWQREMGAADPVGRTILLDGVPHEIIGVMPPTFRFPDPGVDLWKTADLTAEGLLDREDFFVNTVARLAPDHTLEQAREEMAALHASLRAADPARLEGSRAEVVPLRDVLLSGIGPLWLTLMGAVGFVLLIVCANLANLLLSRANARAGELALERALGASRSRIVRQTVTESVVLAGLGGVAGLGLGWLLLRGILAWMPGGVPRAEAVHVDLVVLGFTLAISAAVGVLAGLAPALRLPEAELGARIRTRGAAGKGVRRALVAVEVALAVVLVTGAGLTARGFAAMRGLDPGFSPAGRSVLHVELPGDAGTEDREAFYRSLVRRVEELPGVQAAGVTSVFPMSGFTPGSFVGREGETVSAGDGAPTVRYVGVSPSFRAAAGVPLLAGRDLTDEDGRGGTEAILVSRSAADLLFPGGQALGARVHLGPDGVVAPLSTIVGIVGDVRQQGMAQPAPPMAYVPRRNIAFWRGFDLVVLAQGGMGAALTDELRTVVRTLDERAVVLQPTDARSIVAAATTDQRNTMLLFLLMGAVAMMLAAVGVFGVMTFLVGQRTREMGVRMAMGAGRADLQGLVVRQSLAPAAVGAGTGALVAVWMSRFMEGLVAGIDPTDPLTLAAAPLLLTLVAAAAAWIPARRASRIDPVRVLSE